MMPEGVEHTFLSNTAAIVRVVTDSMMPEGVEHEIKAANDADRAA